MRRILGGWRAGYNADRGGVIPEDNQLQEAGDGVDCWRDSELKVGHQGILAYLGMRQAANGCEAEVFVQVNPTHSKRSRFV